MLIEAGHRAEASAREMLALLNSGTASCSRAREVLAVCKSTAAVAAAAQTHAARLAAGVKGHGGDGAQALAETAGLTRRDALGQAKTARVVETAPVVRDALETGRVVPWPGLTTVCRAAASQADINDVY